MPLDIKQAMRNRAWQPPTPDQEALQDPLFSPSDVGNAAKMGAAGLKGAMMAAPALAGMAKYQVTDNHTGQVVGLYETLKRASHKADKLDNEYGAYRYSTKRVEDKDIAGPSSRIALKPSEMDPNRFDTVRGGPKSKSYDEQGYPIETQLRVTHQPGPMDNDPAFIDYMKKQGASAPSSQKDLYDPPFNVHTDAMNGMNSGHALRRAADNWPSASEVRIVGKQNLKDQMKPKP